MDKKEIKTEELINQMEADYHYYTQELKTLRDIISNKEKRNAALFLEVGRYRKVLEEIEKIVNEPCVADAQEDCKHCDFWCEHKDILDIINKAKGEGK